MHMDLLIGPWCEEKIGNGWGSGVAVCKKKNKQQNDLSTGMKILWAMSGYC